VFLLAFNVLALDSSNLAAHYLHVIFHYVEIFVVFIFLFSRHLQSRFLVLVVKKFPEDIFELIIAEFLLFSSMAYIKFIRAICQDLLRRVVSRMSSVLDLLLIPQLLIVVGCLVKFTHLLWFSIIFEARFISLL
jgi:hypothetical protein